MKKLWKSWWNFEWFSQTFSLESHNRPWIWPMTKKVREKSRECHNHKPQPFPDPKRKSLFYWNSRFILLTVLRRWSRCWSYSLLLCGLFFEAICFMSYLAAELAEIQEKFIIVPVDKTSNNIVFVCKTHYINCLKEELGMSSMTGNPTFNFPMMKF